MMKVSTKGRYALRIMLDLAVHGKEELVTLKDISARQGISEKYMEHIVCALKRSGYLKSLRGSQGGYQLTREPREYTVGMILRTTEGNMAPVSCLEDEENLCGRADCCVSLRLWSMVDEAVKSVIDNVTLQDMLDWEKDNNSSFPT